MARVVGRLLAIQGPGFFLRGAEKQLVISDTHSADALPAFIQPDFRRLAQAIESWEIVHPVVYDAQMRHVLQAR